MHRPPLLIRIAAMTTTYGRSMKAAAAVAAKGDHAFAKADELVQASFERGGSLSMPASKILNLMIAKAAGDAWKDQVHVITRADLRAVKHLTNAEIEVILDELAAVRFKIEGKSARGRRLIRRRPLFRMIDEESTESDDDQIEYEFDPLIRGILARSDHYTVLYRATMLAFTSKYALKLYEIGSRAVRLPDFCWEGTVHDLRELVGVPAGKLRGWKDLRVNVLDKAKVEIDQLAHFTMVYASSKTRGRTVERVRISFVYKTPAGTEEAWQELQRPKIGRKARRRGQVEEIAE